MERSGLRLEHFSLEVVLNYQTKKYLFLADFALQNKVETTLRYLWSKGVSLIFGIFLDVFEFLRFG